MKMKGEWRFVLTVSGQIVDSSKIIKTGTICLGLLVKYEEKM